jgi:ABC-type dipeptide/oligopeptide/nickel transport system permease component
MSRYLVKRILLIIPTFIGITMITYVIVRYAPGDYTTLKAGLQGELKAGAIGQQYLNEERKLYGLDKNPVFGYVSWLGKFVTFDLGSSRRDGRPVTDIMIERLPITLALNIISMLITYIISIPLGIATAVRKDSAFYKGSSIVLFILYSLPAFWIGLLLLTFLSGGEYLDLFPLGGKMSDWAENAGFFARFLDRAWHMVLPIVTLTYGSFAFLSRYTRANML